MARKKHSAPPSYSKGRKEKHPPGRLIFTDLDGTLLERETYSWKPAEPALRGAEKAGIPVIFCTSKTRTEIEYYRKQIKNRHPFIPENGGAIYIPRGYFRHEPPDARKTRKYLIIELGTPYRELREALKSMQRKGLKVRGFSDMSVLELRRLSGLSLRQAYLARKREYDEPFMLEEPRQEPRVLEMIKKRGLQYFRGTRFCHILGNNDKGLAVKILTDIYQQEADMPLVTLGIGDSPNDFPMLRAVHVPYLVKGHDGKYASRSPAFLRADGAGPHGWKSAVLDFLEEEF
jgi:mannosyl-3-phosphoglycerate phosphatase